MSTSLNLTSLEVQGAAIQDIANPDNICFGCGTAHPRGLHIKSHWHEDGVHMICHFTPGPDYQGWPGLVYGGLLAMLVDCHCNWTAMGSHYKAEGREPGTLPRIDCVTGNLGLKYIKPTPMGVELTLKARVEGDVGRKTRILCEIWADDTLTVLADSTFVRI